MNTSHTKISRTYLETSFWAEEKPEEVSDDEGLGSDDSVTSGSDMRGAKCVCDNKQQVKTPLRVTKFLKVLRQSVKRGHHNASDKSSPKSPRSFNSLVFGSDLCNHLSASQKIVPNVVRRVGLSV